MKLTEPVSRNLFISENSVYLMLSALNIFSFGMVLGKNKAFKLKVYVKINEANKKYRRNQDIEQNRY